MSKYVKLYSIGTIKRTLDIRSKEDSRSSSAKLSDSLRKALFLIVFSAITVVTVLAYYSDILFFENIVISLSIIGGVFFIKNINNEKTKITRIKK